MVGLTIADGRQSRSRDQAERSKEHRRRRIAELVTQDDD